MTIHNSTAELIGSTPLIRLNHVTEGIKATIAVKSNTSTPAAPPKTASPNASSTPPRRAASSSPAV